uniref:Uncharacterized protein n=1 Tax=Rhizophora mucronata TaxID=61149 RepID=A0A2P2QL35_RHIMU
MHFLAISMFLQTQDVMYLICLMS